jgi:hypothetical protein
VLRTKPNFLVFCSSGSTLAPHVHSKAADSGSLGITSKSMTDLLLLLALLLVHATDYVLVGLLDGDAIKLSIREHLSCLDREDFL